MSNFIIAWCIGVFIAVVLAFSAQSQTCSQGMVCSHPLPPTATTPPGYQPNVFGPGIDMTNTGQPMVWRTRSGTRPPVGTPVTPDVFGPGIGMDATGRPVRAYRYGGGDGE